MNLEDLKEPFISNELIEYLEKVSTTDQLLSETKDKNSDYRIGYMEGTMNLIGLLKGIKMDQDNEEG